MKYGNFQGNGDIYPKPRRDWVLLHEFIADNESKWHLKDYARKSPKGVTCVLCGSVNFNVCQGEYFTGIRCINCNWELAIHQG